MSYRSSETNCQHGYRHKGIYGRLLTAVSIALVPFGVTIVLVPTVVTIALVPCGVLYIYMIALPIGATVALVPTGVTITLVPFEFRLYNCFPAALRCLWFPSEKIP